MQILTDRVLDGCIGAYESNTTHECQQSNKKNNPFTHTSEFVNLKIINFPQYKKLKISFDLAKCCSVKAFFYFKFSNNLKFLQRFDSSCS